MSDINYWLGRKYDILQQQADTGESQVANVYDIAQKKLPIEETTAKAEAEKARAQGEQARAMAQNLGLQTRTGSAVDTFEVPAIGSSITGARQSIFRIPSMLGQGTDASTSKDPYGMGFGFAKGTARVPGKGDPRVDKVPAKLAPGEAVLNAPAADMAGRGLIAMLNKMGAQKMGMV